MHLLLMGYAVKAISCLNLSIWGKMMYYRRVDCSGASQVVLVVKNCQCRIRIRDADFMEASLHRLDRLNHWCMNLISSPSSLSRGPEVWDEAESSHPLST